MRRVGSGSNGAMPPMDRLEIVKSRSTRDELGRQLRRAPMVRCRSPRNALAPRTSAMGMRVATPPNLWSLPADAVCPSPSSGIGHCPDDRAVIDLNQKNLARYPASEEGSPPRDPRAPSRFLACLASSVDRPWNWARSVAGRLWLGSRPLATSRRHIIDIPELDKVGPSRNEIRAKTHVAAEQSAETAMWRTDSDRNRTRPCQLRADQESPRASRLTINFSIGLRRA